MEADFVSGRHGFRLHVAAESRVDVSIQSALGTVHRVPFDFRRFTRRRYLMHRHSKRCKIYIQEFNLRTRILFNYKNSI